MAKKREGAKGTGGGPADCVCECWRVCVARATECRTERLACWSTWNHSLLPQLRTIMTKELLARNKDKEYCHTVFGYPKDVYNGNRLCFSDLI